MTRDNNKNLPVLEVPGFVKYRNLTQPLSEKSIEVFEAAMEREGVGPALHFHKNMEETFCVLEGYVEFTLGNDKIVLGPSQTLMVPRGIPHAWKSRDNSGARMIFMFTPAQNQWSYLTKLTCLMNQKPDTFENDLTRLFAKYDQNRI